MPPRAAFRRRTRWRSTLNGTEPIGSEVPDGVSWNPVERNWLLRAPWRKRLAAANGLSESCPFCPDGDEAPPTEGPHVVISKYPFIGPPADLSYEPHHVMVFSRLHTRNLVALSEPELVAVIDRVRAESSALLTHDAVQSVYAFQASGPLFGGSISHPHLQVLGFPFVPTKLVPDTTHGCSLCTEFGHPESTVSESDDFVLAVPPWSRMPYEMVISPRQHQQSLEKCDTTQIASLLSRALRAIQGLLPGGDTPYTLNFMTAPKDLANGQPRSLNPRHHLRIEIFPFCTDTGRIRQIVAIEAGTGVGLNPLAPAEAAGRLRRAGALQAEHDRP